MTAVATLTDYTSLKRKGLILKIDDTYNKSVLLLLL